MILRIGNKIVSVTEVPGLTNWRGDQVLGLSCITGKFGWIKLRSDLTLPEFLDYIDGSWGPQSICSIQKKRVMELLGLTREDLGTIITNTARAKEFLLLHEVSHIIHGDSEDERLTQSDHLSPYRVGIEARATNEAWIKMKEKYGNI